jgi:hypothetical protein
MDNPQKGIISVAIVAIIAIVVIAGGVLIYRQTHKQQTDVEQISSDKNNGNGSDENNNNGDNPIPDIQPIQTEPNPGSETGQPILPDGTQKVCPAVLVPGPGFCPSGEIMAKVEESCVVGYECQKTSENSSKCDSACKKQSYESGKCVEKTAGLTGTIEEVYNQPLKGVVTDCLPPEECMCKTTADISCAANDDCLDSGCGECVNYKWSASNNTCNSISDARKICVCEAKKCVAKATCGNKQCEAPYETKFNCQVDCGLAAADKTCKTNADCVDDGTTCHVCVNSAWLKQNPDWSKYYACDGIGAVSCKCQSGQCAAVE